MRAGKPISAPVQSALSELLPEMHDRSGCEKVGLACESFAEILADVAMKYLPTGVTQAEARTFLLSLRVEELALARACAAGHNAAWELFLIRYRKSFISAPCASPARTQPPAISPTHSMPNSTARLLAMASAFPNWHPSRVAGHSKVGFAPCLHKSS